MASRRAEIVRPASQGALRAQDLNFTFTMSATRDGRPAERIGVSDEVNAGCLRGTNFLLRSV